MAYPDDGLSGLLEFIGIDAELDFVESLVSGAFTLEDTRRADLAPLS